MLHENRVSISVVKNLTITVDDAALEWARVEAARRNTSVSRMVGEWVSDMMRHEEAYARAWHEWQSDTSVLDSAGQAYPARARLYGR